MKAVLKKGDIHTDSRGSLRYVNDMSGDYKRFYIITPSDTSTFRGWQGHKIEEKSFFVIEGEFAIAVVEPLNFENPDGKEQPGNFLLSAERNDFLYVPGGCYTGIKSLSPGSVLMVLSNLDLESSKKDDFRQAENKWSVTL